MKPLYNAEQSRSDTAKAYSDLRAYMKSEPYEAMCAWIESLAAGQQVHMTQCSPEKLAAAQTRLKQLLEMRRALMDPGGAFTGSCYD